MFKLSEEIVAPKKITETGTEIPSTGGSVSDRKLKFFENSTRNKKEDLNKLSAQRRWHHFRCVGERT